MMKHNQQNLTEIGNLYSTQNTKAMNSILATPISNTKASKLLSFKIKEITNQYKQYERIKLQGSQGKIIAEIRGR